MDLCQDSPGQVFRRGGGMEGVFKLSVNSAIYGSAFCRSFFPELPCISASMLLFRFQRAEKAISSTATVSATIPRTRETMVPASTQVTAVREEKKASYSRDLFWGPSWWPHPFVGLAPALATGSRFCAVARTTVTETSAQATRSPLVGHRLPAAGLGPAQFHRPSQLEIPGRKRLADAAGKAPSALLRDAQVTVQLHAADAFAVGGILVDGNDPVW